MTIAGRPNMIEAEGAGVRPIAMGDIVDGIWLRRWWIVAATAAALVIALGIISLIEPIYRTQAHVLVENLETPFDRAQSDVSVQQRTLDERDIASQIEVLASAASSLTSQTPPPGSSERRPRWRCGSCRPLPARPA